MIHTFAGALPRHQYVHVQPNALGEHDWLPAVWFGLTSYPGRAWGCHLLLECGAVYRNVPLHHLARKPNDVQWSPKQAQHWDCYGWQFATIEYPYLSGLDTRAKCANDEYEGEYLFTAVPVADAFSAAPEQSKEFYFVALDNGRFTAQPTNRVLLTESSFTDDVSWPRFLRPQSQIWSVE